MQCMVNVKKRKLNYKARQAQNIDSFFNLL